MGIAVPKVVDYLITEDLKRKIIADWDRFREEDPEGWREYLDEAAVWDVTLKDGLETEPPFRSNDQFWLDAGGLPEVNETKDAA